jgi:hypothetical protein
MLYVYFRDCAYGGAEDIYLFLLLMYMEVQILCVYFSS